MADFRNLGELQSAAGLCLVLSIFGYPGPATLGPGDNRDFRRRARPGSPVHVASSALEKRVFISRRMTVEQESRRRASRLQ